MAKEYKLLNVRPYQHYLVGKLAGEIDESVIDTVEEMIAVFVAHKGLAKEKKKWLNKFKSK